MYVCEAMQLLDKHFKVVKGILTRVIFCVKESITLFVLIFARTNFRAFAQKSEKCAKISTVITRKGVMREN